MHLLKHGSFSLKRHAYIVDPLPNDKILDMTELKAFADDKLIVAKMTISLLDGVENPVGKGANAGYLQSFPKPSSLASLKVGTVWQRVKSQSDYVIYKIGGKFFISMCVL